MSPAFWRIDAAARAAAAMTAVGYRMGRCSDPVTAADLRTSLADYLIARDIARGHTQ